MYLKQFVDFLKTSKTVPSVCKM